MAFLFRLLRNNFFGFLCIILFLIGYIQNLRFSQYGSSLFFNNITAASQTVAGWRQSFFNFINLPTENKNLINQNKILLQALATKSLIPVDSNLLKLGYSYEVRTAQIMNGNTNLDKNFFILNKGSKDGVEKGHAVINAKGIIGTVLHTTANLCVVIPLINTKFKLTPSIQELDISDGILVWDGVNENELSLEGVSSYKNVTKGMHLVTSSYSRIFPPNLPIGIITSVNKVSKSAFLKINVTPSANFNQLNNVYVLKNNFVPVIDTMLNTADTLTEE